MNSQKRVSIFWLLFGIFWLAYFAVGGYFVWLVIQALEKFSAS